MVGEAMRREYAVRAHPDDAVNPDKTCDAVRRQVRVNVAENPVDWLAARGMVSEAQQRAAERLRLDYERAGLRRWQNRAVVRGRRMLPWRGLMRIGDFTVRWRLWARDYRTFAGG
jgi:hypothetical protein